MGFLSSFTREIGKNTGKFASNLVFGDKHATPHKHIISRQDQAKRQREREAIKREREASRAHISSEREALKREHNLAQQALKAELEALKELKKTKVLTLKEEKEKIKLQNKKLYDESLAYIESIEKLHTKTSFEVGFRDTEIAKNVRVINLEVELEEFKKKYLESRLKQLSEKLNSKESEIRHEELKSFSALEIMLCNSPETDQDFSKYLTLLKNDQEFRNQFEISLNRFVSKISSEESSKSTLIEELRKELKSVLENNLIDINAEMEKAFGVNWKDKIVLEEELQSKIAALNIEIGELKDAFLGSIRNKKKISDSESEKKQLQDSLSSGIKEVGFKKQRLEKHNAKLKKALDDFEENFQDDITEFLNYRDENIRVFESDLKEQKEINDFVELVKNGDVIALKEVLTDRDIFEFLEDYGSTASVGYRDGIVEVDIYAQFEGVIPENKKVLLANGTLKEKPMTKSEYNLLKQDYVCSCILRIANDYFINLWEDNILINVVVSTLNTATGKNEDCTILSALINRHDIEKINLEKVDASDALEHLGCNMKFSKTNGFSHVSKVEIPQEKQKIDKRDNVKENSKVRDSVKSKSVKRRKRLELSKNANVGDLNKGIRKFGYKVKVFTSTMKKAADNRRLSTLAGTDYEEYNQLIDEPYKEKIENLLERIGLNFEIQDL